MTRVVQGPMREVVHARMGTVSVVVTLSCGHERVYGGNRSAPRHRARCHVCKYVYKRRASR